MARLLIHEPASPVVEVVSCPECDRPGHVVAFSVTHSTMLLACHACRLVFTQPLVDDNFRITKED